MRISKYFCVILKVLKKIPHSKALTSLMTAAFVGLAVPVYASLITINAIAPSQQQLYNLGDISEATDFCIGATGNPMDDNQFGSNIINSYFMAADANRFVSSQDISGAGSGFTDGGTAQIDWLPTSPLSSPEAMCWDFDDDPVDPGELFSVVVDVWWLEDADIVANGDIYNASAITPDDCFLSYHTDNDGNDISPPIYAPVVCELSLEPPSILAANAGMAKVIYDDGDVRLYTVVSTPSMSMITLLLLGGLLMRRSFKSAKK